MSEDTALQPNAQIRFELDGPTDINALEPLVGGYHAFEDINSTLDARRHALALLVLSAPKEWGVGASPHKTSLTFHFTHFTHFTAWQPAVTPLRLGVG